MGFAFLLGLLVVMGMAILLMASIYTLFEKAGEPGFTAFVPFYNLYQMVKIAGLPGPALLLFFVPVANYVFPIYLWYRIARRFQQDMGISVLTGIFPFFLLPYLAFNDACQFGCRVSDAELIQRGRRAEQGLPPAVGAGAGMPNIATAGWQGSPIQPAPAAASTDGDVPPVEAAYGAQPRRQAPAPQAPHQPEAPAGGVTFGVDL